MKGTSSSLFFRDVVTVQSLVCSNLVIQSVLKKICSESGEHLQSLLLSSGGDSRRHAAETHADKKRYWVISKTGIEFISLDVMLYNGCFSHTELVLAEQIQLLMCCIQ